MRFVGHRHCAHSTSIFLILLVNSSLRHRQDHGIWWYIGVCDRDAFAPIGLAIKILVIYAVWAHFGYRILSDHSLWLVGYVTITTAFWWNRIWWPSGLDAFGKIRRAHLATRALNCAAMNRKSREKQMNATDKTSEDERGRDCRSAESSLYSSTLAWTPSAAQNHWVMPVSQSVRDALRLKTQHKLWRLRSRLPDATLL